MKLKLVSSFALLAVAAFGQLNPGPNAPKQTTTVTKREALNALAAAGKSPKLLYAEDFFVVPQIADGTQAGQGVWTTAFHIINLDTANSWPYELDFYTPAGAAASVGIVGLGSVTSVSGTLVPGQVVTYVTSGLPATVQTYWGVLNLNNSGPWVSVWETVNLANSAANYLSSMAGPSDFGVNYTSTNPGLFFPFDNTNNQFTTAAFANPDFTNYYNANTLQIQFLDSTGTLIDTENYTVNPGTQTAVVVSNTWPKTANIAGTMYIIPYDPSSGSNPAFSPITILGLQAVYTQNGAGFSHTNSFVPLMTLGNY